MHLIAFFISIALIAAPAVAHEHHDESHPMAGTVSLDVTTQNDTLDLFVVDSVESFPRMKHSRTRDGGKTWTTTVIDVAGSRMLLPHRGDDPRIAVFGDHLLAMWTAKGSSEWGGGDLQTAISSDGGASWLAGGNPADDRSGGKTDHGFIALASDKQGTFHAVWFDPRQGKQGLRYSQSRDFGKTWSKNVTIDKATCQCCWNSLYVGDNGSLTVLYRALSPRDMAMQKSTDDGKTWKKVSTVGKFDWHFNGCPHVGGSLARTAGDLHSLVWTGKAKQQGLYVMDSTNDGKTWGPPLKLGGDHAQHGDLVSHGSSLVAVWDDIVDNHYVIRMQSSVDGGKTWSKPTTVSDDKASATHPRVVYSAGSFEIFWTEAREAAPNQWAMKQFKL